MKDKILLSNLIKMKKPLSFLKMRGVSINDIDYHSLDNKGRNFWLNLKTNCMLTPKSEKMILVNEAIKQKVKLDLVDPINGNIYLHKILKNKNLYLVLNNLIKNKLIKLEDLKQKNNKNEKVIELLYNYDVGVLFYVQIKNYITELFEKNNNKETNEDYMVDIISSKNLYLIKVYNNLTVCLLNLNLIKSIEINPINNKLLLKKLKYQSYDDDIFKIKFFNTFFNYKDNYYPLLKYNNIDDVYNIIITILVNIHNKNNYKRYYIGNTLFHYDLIEYMLINNKEYLLNKYLSKDLIDMKNSIKEKILLDKDSKNLIFSKNKKQKYKI